jgi:hypothetical protein
MLNNWWIAPLDLENLVHSCIYFLVPWAAKHRPKIAIVTWCTLMLPSVFCSVMSSFIQVLSSPETRQSLLNFISWRRCRARGQCTSSNCVCCQNPYDTVDIDLFLRRRWYQWATYFAYVKSAAFLFRIEKYVCDRVLFFWIDGTLQSIFWLLANPRLERVS